MFNIMKLKKLLFQVIYKTYIWSSQGNIEFGLAERVVEYPFVIKNLMKDLPLGRRVLIVGCHGDYLTTILSVMGYKVWGLDVKFVPLKYPNFHFIQGDIRHTSFPDGFFDAVVAVSTIEHVGVFAGEIDGDGEAINEIVRVSVKGGILLMTVPYGKEMAVDRFQRVYDEEGARNLLKGLAIKEFMVFKKDSDGYWVKTSTPHLRDDDFRSFAAALLKVRLP